MHLADEAIDVEDQPTVARRLSRASWKFTVTGGPN
jgi:hypothetical protein